MPGEDESTPNPVRPLQSEAEHMMTANRARRPYPMALIT